MLPHLILAVDFGTQFTKVCWALRYRDYSSYYRTEFLEWEDTKTRLLPTVVTKVNTHLIYGWDALREGEKNLFRTTFMGFKMELLRGQPQVFAMGDTGNVNPEDTVRLTSGYLQYLLERARARVQLALQNEHFVTWDKADIHLVLSKPAAGDYEQLDKYHESLSNAFKKAGFNLGSHKIIESMKEPKAAVRYALQHRGDGGAAYEDGDICVLVDVGGGTADLCAFLIEDIKNFILSPAGIQPTRGINIGGQMLNKYLEKTLLRRYFEHHDSLLPGVQASDAARVLAWNIRAFENTAIALKMRYSAVEPPDTASIGNLKLRTHVGVLNGKKTTSSQTGLLCDGKEITGSFLQLLPCLEQQLFGKNGKIGSAGIWDLIGSTADDIFVSCPEAPQPPSNRESKSEMSSSLFEFKPSNPPKVKHIILTGGFCTGEYVRSAVEDALRRSTTISPDQQIGEPTHTNIAPSCVRTIGQPQFCVAWGLMQLYQEEMSAELTAKENKKPGLVGKTWLRFKASLQ